MFKDSSIKGDQTALCIRDGLLQNFQIPGDMIFKGFKECGYIEWNGSLDLLHSRLNDTVANISVPMNLILKVDEMLLAMDEELLEKPTIEDASSDSEDDPEVNSEADDADTENEDESSGIESEIDIE